MQFRAVDATTVEIKKRALSDVIETERKNICARGVKTNLRRNINHHRVEHELYLTDIKIKNTYSNVQANLEQEQKLARELQNARREEINEIKRRQQLRESSSELRDLKSQLRAAYITKELFAQIKEKEYLKFKDKMEAREADEVLRSALRSNIEAEKKEAQDDLMRKLEYKKDLQDQMIMKRQQDQYKYENEYLKEKKLLDEVMQRIHDEDEREINDKECKRKRFNAEIDAFKKAQEVWRQKKKMELEEDNKKLEEFKKNKEKQDRVIKVKNIEARLAREKAMEEVAKKTYIEQYERKELQETLEDLMDEEVKEKQEQRVKRESQDLRRRKIEWQNVLNRQMEERVEKAREAQREEIQYKNDLMAKIKEDDRVEKLKEDKRKQKMLDLRHDVERTIKEREAKRAEDMRTFAFLQKEAKDQEDKDWKIIEDDRLRLLKEHASNLMGYLPPGVLRPEDLPHLGPEYVEYYSKK